MGFLVKLAVGFCIRFVLVTMSVQIPVFSVAIGSGSPHWPVPSAIAFPWVQSLHLASPNSAFVLEFLLLCIRFREWLILSKNYSLV